MCSSKITAFLASIRQTLVRLVKRAPAKPVVNSNTPWQANLQRLADQRKEDLSLPPPAVHLDEVTAFVNELAKSAKPKQAYAPPPPEQKRRRTTDLTVTDLKAWWGDSVATWDPDMDGKNVTSADQRPHTRQANWFNRYNSNKE